VQPALDRPARYRDFVAWQQERPLDDARAFWTRHFDGFAPPARLSARHDAADDAAPEVRVELTAAETHAVERFARSQRIATNTLVEGAWALWLARHAGHDDVSFGVTLAGRDAGVPDVERLVGLTLNKHPQRVRVAAGATLGDLLGELHDAQAEMQQHAHVPLEQVQEWSGVPWRTRLFETLLVFQHDDAETSTRAWLGGGVRIDSLHVPTRTAYPLSLIVAGEETLSLRATYDPRYFDAESARAMVEGLRAALLAMAATASSAALGELLATLPEPPRGAERAVEEAAYVEPRTATEAVLASIWSEVLGVERVGVDDNFFALGGYSLVATQIVSRVRSTLQIEMPVRLLFQQPTVRTLAVALAARERRAGQLERVAQVVRRVQTMSLDDLRRAESARAVIT
jgi:non-ribosomal peptide synthetase component F